MRIISSFLIVFIALFQGVSACAQCGRRYTNQIFPAFTLDSVVYSLPHSLKMDIYRPVSDAMAKRPLIIFAHEGGFSSAIEKL